MKTCPFCAEEIRDRAIVCRYCRSDLQGGEPGRTPAVGQTTTLVVQHPEPDNPADCRALKVCTTGGVKVGYLSPHDAAAYRIAFRRLAARGLEGVCDARLTGGTADQPGIGVMLDLRDPADLAAVKRLS